MNGRLPVTPGSWLSFIDAWVQYYKITMPESARAALCNAFVGLSQSEIAAIQSTPVAPRFLTPDEVVVHGEEVTVGRPPRVIRARPVTDVVKGVPVSTATTVESPQVKPARIMRTPRKE